MRKEMIRIVAIVSTLIALAAAIAMLFPVDSSIQKLCNGIMLVNWFIYLLYLIWGKK